MKQCLRKDIEDAVIELRSALMSERRRDQTRGELIREWMNGGLPDTTTLGQMKEKHADIFNTEANKIGVAVDKLKTLLMREESLFEDMIPKSAT